MGIIELRLPQGRFGRFGEIAKATAASRGIEIKVSAPGPLDPPDKRVERPTIKDGDQVINGMPACYSWIKNQSPGRC